MNTIYLVDGKPHRICDCPKLEGKCPRGVERTLQTTQLSQCFVPAPDVLIAGSAVPEALRKLCNDCGCEADCISEGCSKLIRDFWTVDGQLHGPHNQKARDALVRLRNAAVSINVLAAPSPEHRPSKPEDGALRTPEDTISALSPLARSQEKT